MIFNSESVSIEVIRTIVGSLGILAAVPLTTFVAAAMLDRPAGAEAESGRDRTAVALDRDGRAVGTLVFVVPANGS